MNVDVELSRISNTDQIVQIAAGDAHNLIIMSSGRMYVFGYNNKGQCGLGTTS